MRACARPRAAGREAAAGKRGPFSSHALWAARAAAQDETSAAEVARQIHVLLKGKPIDHVVSSIGFGRVTQGGATAAKLSDLREEMETCVYPAYLAAQALLPSMRDHGGASYTIVSCTTVVVADGFWATAIKNAALNALAQGLAKEHAQHAVRINAVSLGFAVARIDQ